MHLVTNGPPGTIATPAAYQFFFRALRLGIAVAGSLKGGFAPEMAFLEPFLPVLYGRISAYVAESVQQGGVLVAGHSTIRWLRRVRRKILLLAIVHGAGICVDSAATAQANVINFQQRVQQFSQVALPELFNVVLSDWMASPPELREVEAMDLCDQSMNNLGVRLPLAGRSMRTDIRWRRRRSCRVRCCSRSSTRSSSRWSSTSNRGTTTCTARSGGASTLSSVRCSRPGRDTASLTSRGPPGFACSTRLIREHTVDLLQQTLLMHHACTEMERLPRPDQERVLKISLEGMKVYNRDVAKNALVMAYHFFGNFHPSILVPTSFEPSRTPPPDSAFLALAVEPILDGVWDVMTDSEHKNSKSTRNISLKNSLSSPSPTAFENQCV